MWKWCNIDEWGIRWLRDNPNTLVALDRGCLADLARRYKLLRARPLGRTKFGLHVEEYREDCKERSLHVREFDDHLEIHTDYWNPDWSAWAFVRHLFADTDLFQIIFTVAATTLALRYVVS